MTVYIVTKYSGNTWEGDTDIVAVYRHAHAAQNYIVKHDKRSEYEKWSIETHKVNESAE